MSDESISEEDEKSALRKATELVNTTYVYMSALAGQACLNIYNTTNAKLIATKVTADDQEVYFYTTLTKLHDQIFFTLDKFETKYVTDAERIIHRLGLMYADDAFHLRVEQLTDDGNLLVGIRYRIQTKNISTNQIDNCDVFGGVVAYLLSLSECFRPATNETISMLESCDELLQSAAPDTTVTVLEKWKRIDTNATEIEEVINDASEPETRLNEQIGTVSKIQTVVINSMTRQYTFFITPVTGGKEKRCDIWLNETSDDYDLHTIHGIQSGCLIAYVLEDESTLKHFRLLKQTGLC